MLQDTVHCIGIGRLYEQVHYAHVQAPNLIPTVAQKTSIFVVELE